MPCTCHAPLLLVLSLRSSAAFSGYAPPPPLQPTFLALRVYDTPGAMVRLSPLLPWWCVAALPRRARCRALFKARVESILAMHVPPATQLATPKPSSAPALLCMRSMAMRPIVLAPIVHRPDSTNRMPDRSVLPHSIRSQWPRVRSSSVAAPPLIVPASRIDRSIRTPSIPDAMGQTAII